MERWTFLLRGVKKSVKKRIKTVLANTHTAPQASSRRKGHHLLLYKLLGRRGYGTTCSIGIITGDHREGLEIMLRLMFGQVLFL